MVLSALGFTFLNTMVKQLSHFDTYEIVFFRSIGTLFFTIPLLLKNKIDFKGNNKLWLVIRSIVGLSSMIFFFSSLKYITMGSAVSLRYIAPIFAAFFALFYLKEKIKPIQWFFFVIAFSGVLVLKGFDAEMNSIGLMYALLSAFFAGLVYISIRKIGKGDHPLVVVNYFMVISAIVGGALAIKNWKNPIELEWLMLLSLGVFGYIGQLYMTKAFQVAETNQAAPLKYIEVIFTILVGLTWFGELYTLGSILGILLIVIGLSLNVLVGRKKDKTDYKNFKEKNL